MELRHLRYFITVAEELHFSRAAERLNIAAPTLTVQIQEIERVLSVRLFTRTKRSVMLTSAGKVFSMKPVSFWTSMQRQKVPDGGPDGAK
ncbi:LysR family transcriptional regulator [Brucella pituitosa]|uniref:LysR family transcriptional regulator n=1 Tax=Brucella pituitosa TaxID=571256 RepID=UPI001C26AFB3|nr:LysR family transcriptional regulator [Brucella pituitosa]